MLKVIIISLMQNSLRVDALPFLEINPLSKQKEKRASFAAPWMIPESALKGIPRFYKINLVTGGIMKCPKNM